MNTFVATKAWLVFGAVAISAVVGYGCSSTGVSIPGSKNDHLSGDGGDADDGGAAQDDDAEDGGAQKEACGSGVGSCSDPNAVCAYRIEDACSAVGECIVPGDRACLPDVRVVGCDCAGDAIVSGTGCDTAGLPSGYTSQPMSQRFQGVAPDQPCTKGDQDAGAADDGDQDGGAADDGDQDAGAADDGDQDAGAAGG